MAAAAPAKQDDPDTLARKEVVRTLKGPVADIMRGLLPGLPAGGDTYSLIIDDHTLLDAAFAAFRQNRQAFAALLIAPDGTPVTDDQIRLKCGRSVAEVTGMAVRSGMRAFAEHHFGDKIKAGRATAPAAQGSGFRLLNLARITELFVRNYGSDRAPGAGQTRATRFYNAIRDVLDFDWQVRFFPVYVAIPVHIIEKLGTGITRLDNEESIHRLAQLAASDISKAESIIKDPAMIREMLDNNVLASAAIADMGEAGFENIRDAFEKVDPKKRWDIFANKDTLRYLQNDKRITKADITALADYLDILNVIAIDLMIGLKLNRAQMKLFLKTAEEHLGHFLFLCLFGPIQTIPPQDPAEQQKLQKYQTYTKSALKSLISAAKELGERGGDDLDMSLATVCRAKCTEMEREVRKLAPAGALPATGK